MVITYMKILTNSFFFTVFGSILILCRHPRGEGGQPNVYFTKQPYLVKLSTKGEGGQKCPKSCLRRKSMPPLADKSDDVVKRTTLRPILCVIFPFSSKAHRVISLASECNTVTTGVQPRRRRRQQVLHAGAQTEFTKSNN